MRFRPSYLLLFLSIILVFSCTNKPEKLTQKAPFFDPVGLGIINPVDSLSFEAQFNECGEWGGHKEQIVVKADSVMKVYARYRVYPFDCDSLTYYHSNQKVKPLVDKEVLLNEQRKKSITSYILRLAEAKISETFPGHAGETFTVVCSDSSLVIQVYDNKATNVKSFKRLVAELF